MNVTYLLVLLFYFFIILFFNLVFAKKVRSLEDYFLASRDLPAFWVGLALSSSWFGATSILVSTDEAYRTGTSALWLMGVPAAATLLIFALLLGARIQRFKTLSLPDLIEVCYGKLVRHLSSFLILWYLVVLAASQMVAIGNFLKMSLGVSYLTSLAVGMVFVLFYSILGGFRAVVLTNSLKFFLLVTGILVLFLFLAGKSSWTDVSLLASRAGKGHYFNFFAGFGRNSLVALSFTLAWTVSPIAWQRIQAARSEEQARRGIFGSIGTLIVLYILAVLIGLFSLPLYSGKELANPLLSELIASQTGLLLGSLLFVAVVSAILSTLDSAINTGALSLVRDVFQQVFPRTQLNRMVLSGRLATLIIGILAFLVATRFQDILKTIGLSSEIMAEGLFVPGVAMVFLKKRYPLAGLLGLCFGGCFSIGSFLGEARIIPLSLPRWPYSVPYGVALSLAGFLLGLIINKVRCNKFPGPRVSP